MIKIAGTNIPSPTEITPSMYDITEGERDSTGTMHIDLIATKYKLQLKWGVLSKDELSNILQKIKPITFSVTFDDPESGIEKTITVYKGDRTMPVLFFKDGTPYYKDFSVNLIEL